jgi:hypothetical protein
MSITVANQLIICFVVSLLFSAAHHENSDAFIVRFIGTTAVTFVILAVINLFTPVDLRW